MKKLTITAIVLALTILLTSCAEPKVEPQNIDELIACFGQEKSKILEVMNLDEDTARADIKIYPDVPERFPLKQQQKILGEDFTTIIKSFDEEKTVFAVEYHKSSTDVEAALKLAKEIDSQLSSRYEKDTSFAGRSIADVPSLEVFTEMAQHYGTQWVYKDDINVGLAVNIDVATNSKFSVGILLEFTIVNRENYLPFGFPEGT